MQHVSSSGVNISISIGKLELISAGTLHITNETTISLVIDTLKYDFRFKNDDKEKRYIGSLENDVMMVDFYNHNNSLGEGVFEPFEIGKVAGNKILMTYYTSQISEENGARKFEYVLYKERA